MGMSLSVTIGYGFVIKSDRDEAGDTAIELFEILGVDDYDADDPLYGLERFLDSYNVYPAVYGVGDYLSIVIMDRETSQSLYSVKPVEVPTLSDEALDNLEKVRELLKVETPIGLHALPLYW